MLKEQITDFEKLIYNKHLIISKTQKNKPFKPKKDFTSIVNTDKHKFLKRIAIFLQKHKEVDLDVFFKAPYQLYTDVEYFDLEYFSSLRAIKSYTTYKKTLLLQDPDEQVDKIKHSLAFIAKFCIDKKVYMHQYTQLKTGDLFTWMVHLKENKINCYSLFEFPNILSSAKSLTEETQHFFVSNFLNNFVNLHTKYINSSKARITAKKSFLVLNNFVETELKKTKK